MHHRSHRQALYRAMAFSTLWLASGMALTHAASINTADDQYLRDAQTCKAGRSGQDKDTCMTEARRALDARKKGALETDTGAVATNARKRCEVLTGDDKASCLARMKGQGSTSGSVTGGGILREVETVVMPPAAASSTEIPKIADPLNNATTKP